MLAGATQGLALFQLLLLFLGEGPGPASDAYFYIVAWIQVPWQIVLLGVVYPTWVRGAHVPNERAWLAVVPLLSAAAGVIASYLFARLSEPYPELWLHCVLMSSLGLISGALWAVVLRLAAENDPLWFAAVTLPANFAACVALVICQALPLPGRVTALLGAQVLGSAVYLVIVALRMHRIRSRTVSAPRHTESSAHRWFLAQSATAYGSNLFIQTQTATLPANALSSLGIVSRIVAGITAVVTNAILPRLVHRDTLSADPTYRFVLFVNVGAWATLPLALAAIVAANLQDSIAGYALLVIPWAVAANLNASMKRVAARFLPGRVAMFSIIPAVLIPAALSIANALGLLNLIVVIGALILMDLVPGVILSVVQRRFGIAISATLCAIVSLLLAQAILSPTPTF
ncbi:hypothetical protein [Microbacterium sp. Leaf288]|uniref:hypothetical protein n=1 Tax=Microbacterium sp. Leaf288 TaxID=1736323 RepID=UPI000B2BB1DC|nr:hypothetical protein [Microbacterium sp. Leaf288]